MPTFQQTDGSQEVNFNLVYQQNEAAVVYYLFQIYDHFLSDFEHRLVFYLSNSAYQC